MDLLHTVAQFVLVKLGYGIDYSSGAGAGV